MKGLHGVGASYRAWACDVDGKLAGAVGLALTRPRACLFCWIDEPLKPHLRTMPVLRAIKKIGDLIRERGLPVYAVREPDEPKAESMLKRLGFVPLGEVDGDEVWEWTG